jgi:hypothetical protein
VGEGDASADDRIQIGRLQNILGTTLRAL